MLFGEILAGVPGAVWCPWWFITSPRSRYWIPRLGRPFTNCTTSGTWSPLWPASTIFGPVAGICFAGPMQYGEVITRAFSIAWRFKYLWLLALLGGIDVGTSGGGGFPGFSTLSPSMGPPPDAGTDIARQVTGFVHDHLGTLIAIGVVVLLLSLAWMLLSSVTIGALVRAAAEHDAERPFDFGAAWRAGVWTFWPVLRLRLLAALWGLVLLALFVLLVVLGVGSAVNSNFSGLAMVMAIGIPVALILMLSSIPIGIAFILGVRSVVLDQRGAIGGLARGIRLLRTRTGRVLLVWLIGIALQFAVGFGLGVVFLFVTIPMALVAAAALALGGPTAGIVVAVPLALLFVVVLFVVGAVTGSYFSTYWTLAFRRLEIDATPLPAYRLAYPGPQPPVAGA